MRKNTKSKNGTNGIHYVADTSGQNSDNVSDFIRKRAYELFEMRGRIPGLAMQDWLQAEQEIRTRLQV